MGENKFIKHLKGEDTAKSVLEIKNQRTTTSFANMPDGDTSNANDVYSDHRGNATGVLKGTENWKLDGQNLVETTTVYGDGRDFSNSTYEASGNGLWVDASCTFATSKRFAPNTKFVLKLCGHDLETVINHTVDFTLIVKFGVSNLISKTFTVTEQAFNFCKEFAIDFAESNSSAIKADAGSTMQIQLLCSDANARAVIYNGMTVFTALQRRVDGDAVASDKKTFDEVVQDIDDINDEIDQIHEDIDGLEEYVDDTFVKKAGDTMTGALSILRTSSSNTPLITIGNGTASSRRWNFLPSYNATSLSVYSGTSETGGYRFTLNGFVPASNNARDLGSSSLKWKTVYAGMLNNGANLVIPNKAGTLATMGDVELAAQSGTQLYPTGVWYAKMYRGTVVPSGAEYDGRNYADFSQVGRDDDPIIIIYEGQGGRWAEVRRITPPAEYDGYITVTSKIWDIAEQAGQQGGRVLWSHTSREFTPYPLIVSFEDINVTGNSTVVMPQNPGANQIVNKDYVDNHIPTGNFYHPDLFDWKWADHQVNDVQWLRADTFSWQAGSVYESAYQHLADDIDGFSSSIDILIPAQGESLTFVRYEDGDITGYYAWKNNDSIAYTNTLSLSVGDDAYLSLSPVKTGEITSVNNSLQSETIGGVTVQFYLADDGHKICPASEENNVAAIYVATGVAWYYIIDTVNERFKLPRTKFGVTGLRDTVGNYVAAGLPDHNHKIIINTKWGSQNNNNGPNWCGDDATRATNIAATSTNASESNSIYGNSATVQPPATQMYLYFYVGEFTQTALENTAGITAETLNDKVDIGHQVIAFQAPTADNNYTWYRKYADGWVEQGQTNLILQDSATTYTLPIEMESGYYNLCVGFNQSSDGTTMPSTYDRTTTTFSVNSPAGNVAGWWEVKGMSA